ncbi:MAG: ABC transporter permease subunit, partial [Waterburya sp.]
MQQLPKIPLWRDSRVIKIVIQVIILAIVISAIALLSSNLVNNLERLDLTFGFNFLSRSASFSIAHPPIPYYTTDPYIRALLVGLLNSLRVMFFGIIFASILGISIGIGRLSNNWLVRKLAGVYVEVLRNTPLLLQLFFWYFAVFLRLPKIDRPLVIGNLFFLTNRGLDIPWFVVNLRTEIVFGYILVCILVVIAAWIKRLQVIEQGEESPQWLWLCLCGISLITIILLFCFGIEWAVPQLSENSLEGGLNLSPEFA